jgi:hypothetical protein
LAVANLKVVKKVFDEFGIEFWLDGGTLLGAVREGKIIEWDYDIDLSMRNYDEKKLFLALHELKKRKFKLTLDSPLYPNIGVVKLRLFPFDCRMDISLWKAKADEFINPTPMHEGSYQEPINSIQYFLRILRHYLCCDIPLSVPEKRMKHVANILDYSLSLLPLKLKTFLLNILQRRKLGYGNWLFFTPKRYYEKLETTKFYGLEFRIPFDFEDYLKYHYGENWKIPQKKWDWQKDDMAQNWIKGY